jgi:5'-phosphate synthase pdxT subunit
VQPRPVVGVLALQGDVREHLAARESGGARAVPVRRPAELDAVDALVLPGGESTTIGKLLELVELDAPVRERIAAGMPVYGSCAGMILLADRLVGAPADQRTLGGIDMTVRRNAFGRQVDSFEGDLAVPALGPQAAVRATFIRAPWAEEVGDGVEVLARVGSGPAAGRIVAVRQGARLATAFHPEIGGDDRVHALFVEMVRSRRAA